MNEKFDWSKDERSEAELFLTVLAYRPKRKIHDPEVMRDVRELERMRLNGEAIPDVDGLPAFRRALGLKREAISS